MPEDLSQTGFSQNQQILQAPPQPELTPEEALNLEKKKKLKKRLLILVGSVALLIVSVVLIIFTTQVRQASLPSVEFETPPPKPPTEFGQRLLDLKDQVEASDPTLIELAPPAIDYTLQI